DVGVVLRYAAASSEVADVDVPPEASHRRHGAVLLVCFQELRVPFAASDADRCLICDGIRPFFGGAEATFAFLGHLCCSYEGRRPAPETRSFQNGPWRGGRGRGEVRCHRHPLMQQLVSTKGLQGSPLLATKPGHGRARRTLRSSPS